ncbi:hypothetical protein HDU83_003820 [Entophlyctis luteolus]|nr:hypothetical protein HDU83_003820 [Entophlyctis luteolus]
MGPPSTNKKTPVSALSAKSDAKGRDTKAPVKQSANLKKQTFEEDVEGSKVSGRALDLAEGYCLSADQIEELMALDLDSSFEYYSIGKKSIKVADMMNFRNWKDDLQASIMLSFFFGLFQFAKEIELLPPQTSIFMSIMNSSLKKISTEQNADSVVNAVEHFKGLMLMFSSHLHSEDCFGPRESKLAVDFAFSTQESVTLQIAVEVEIPLDPLPLDQAITLEEHEERLAKMQEAEELTRLEKERREAEERAAAANPFDALEPEQVKRIAADTMAAMLQAVAEELDALVEDQRVRLLARAARICLGSAGDAKG